MIRLVIPEEMSEDTAPTAQVTTPRVSKLRIGILDNSKSNADHLLSHLAMRIGDHMTVGGVVIGRKPGTALAARPDVIDMLVKEADCVITAMAD